MSVKHAMTVSTVPAATSSRSSSSVSIAADTTPAAEVATSGTIALASLELGQPAREAIT